MIAYKVVRQDRSSISVSAEEYCLRYDKRTLVKAIPGSLGIFCFEKKENAVDFLDYQSIPVKNDSRIIEVEPIGEGRVPYEISLFTSSYSIKRFYNHCQQGFGACTPPRGTVCYDEVLVLE